ncbi:MAG: PKD domain-containing protein [Methanothrix sp.]|nr:PKD domain-containing protein [Methanothrix sp.]
MIFFVLAVITFTACAQEVAYAYGDSGERPLESGNITKYNGTDLVTSAIASGRYDGRSASQGLGISVEEMKREIALKLNVGNPWVRDEGRSLILEYPGDGTINQICSIYEHMVGNWSYARDTRGIEEFQYSNQSLEYGKGKFSGQGDCDDFSILMASLIESIGGTSRIVLAYGPDGGHAYTEVFLGKAGNSESDVQRMVAWLRKNYKVKEINTHTDLKTGDVWLNLDWWKEPGGAKHPGGPFFEATSHTPIPTRVGILPAPLTPVNDPPEAMFIISPSPPIVGENASFDASESRDIGGRIDAFLWDFGDGNKTDKMSEPTVNHIYLKGGPCTVILIVEDDEGATSIISKNMTINNPPQANFTIMPQKPVVGDLVKFDASKSYDAEDGKSLAYHWEINNNSAIFSVVSPPRQVYDEMGMYWINLTVTDKNGAKGYKKSLLKINHPPIPRIAIDSANLSLGKMINFSAGSSEDLDGEIVSYAWDFGDKSAVDYNKTVLHSYREGGEKTVRLSIRDNDGAISNISQEISVNRPPVARFSIDPVGPKKGELVSFDASESSDPDGKIQRYLWDFGVGRAEPDVYYSEFAEYTYNRHNKYNITLTVVDDREATDSISQLVEVRDTNKKPIVDILQPDEKSPQIVASTITWTAKASDTEGDPLQFRFLLDEQVMQNWSESPVWRWTITDEQAGLHKIEVEVRDGKHNSEGDSSKGADFEVIPLNLEGIASGRSLPNEPPVLTDLYPVMIVAPGAIGITKMSGPLVAGNTVFWTAEASDPEDDPLQFQFSLDGLVMKKWSKSFAWNWTPTKEQVGNHVIEVKVRDGNHAGSDSSDDGKSLIFVVNNPPSNSLTQGYSSDSVETSHSYAGITRRPYTGSTASVVYSGSGQSDSRSTINTTSDAAITGGGFTYYSASSCLSCGNTSETGSSAVNSNESSTFWLKRGDELFALGKCDDAIEAYNKSCMLDRKNAKPLFGKGKALFAKGKYEEALIWLTTAIELSPQYKLLNSEYADMWIYRGNALKNLGRDIEADAAFDKAEDLDPSRHPELEAVVESCA